MKAGERVREPAVVDGRSPATGRLPRAAARLPFPTNGLRPEVLPFLDALAELLAAAVLRDLREQDEAVVPTRRNGAGREHVE